MSQRPLRFFRRGQVVTLDAVDSNRTLLDLLREDLHCSGTKEGCGEGDCGACTVVLAEAHEGTLQYSAINSCIRLAHSVHGMALWTAEDLAQADGRLHPVQQAMVQCHASQCGFCTPGFVMSLFGQYQQQAGAPLSRSQAQTALSGNLCRCTGYRPILDAAQSMHTLPPVAQDTQQVLQGLQQIAQADQVDQAVRTAAPNASSSDAYQAPTELLALLQARRAAPQAQLVAGCTDVGLWITKGHRRFAQLLDISKVAALRRIEHYPHHLAIGAAATLSAAFAALVAQRPQLAQFAQRFAGLPVRNSGTLGGNVANGSPIGDSMPLLIALGAHIVLMRAHGKGLAHRTMALEDFYTGYRKNQLAADEVLAWIMVPHATEHEFSRVYKVSKRQEDDISAVCLALQLHIVQGRVETASIGAGGVAATPVRARQTEAALRGQPWTQATVATAMQTLRAEFAPISDMRASAAYRSEVLGNLLQRFWLESQGAAAVSLAQWTEEGAAA